MYTHKEVAKNVVINHLNAGGTPDCICDVFEIRSGDEELLLRHFKALRYIFDKAIKEMTNERKGDK